MGSSRISFIGDKILNSSSLNLSVGTATIEDQIALTLIGDEKLNFKRIFRCRSRGYLTKHDLNLIQIDGKV